VEKRRILPCRESPSRWIDLYFLIHFMMFNESGQYRDYVVSMIGWLINTELCKGSSWTQPALVLLWPPRIQHDLTLDRTWSATVGSQRPTAGAVARPPFFLGRAIFEQFD
jgi:hypothetical protein